jgi:hypothetical protein
MGKHKDKKDKGSDQHYIDNDTHTLKKFNDMIKKAQGILVCDAACQAQRGRNNLRQKYLDAKQNYLTAPEQVEHTFKNYYVYEKGELAYNQEQEKILEKRANVIVQQFSQSFRENMTQSKVLMESYTSLLVNFQHVSDYLINLTKENAILRKKLDDLRADIITNDRKTYYEDQGIDSLYFYYRIFLGVYVLILLVFLGCMFFKQSHFTRGKQATILVFMILYLFLATPFFIWMIDSFKKIGEMLPKNVYKTL